MVGRRLTVEEAADALGVSENAVRMRVRRGTLASEKDEEGRVWVLVGPDEPVSVSDQHATNQQTNLPTNELLDELRDRLRFVEGQLAEEREARRRADTLLARLMDRVPELESAETSEKVAQQAPESDPDPEDREPEYREPSEDRERGFWRRLFGRE